MNTYKETEQLLKNLRNAAIAYADQKESEREPNGLAGIFLWNRDYEDKLKELHVIEIFRKNVYGLEKIYVKDLRMAGAIRALTGKITIDVKDMANLKFLGFTFLEALPPKDCDGKHESVHDIIHCEDCSNLLDKLED